VDEKYGEDLAIEKKRLRMGKKSDILYIGQYLRSFTIEKFLRIKTTSVIACTER
jgi:hypothetical protein